MALDFSVCTPARKLKKDSYQAWERKMHVSLGYINLKAELLPIAKK